MNLDSTDYNLLLAHMLRTPSILELAHKTLHSSHLKNPELNGTLFYSFAFGIITQHFDKWKTPPDLATLQSELAQVMRNYWSDTSSPDVRMIFRQQDELMRLLPFVDMASVPRVRAVIEHLNQVCVVNTRIAQAIDEAKITQSLGDLHEKLTLIQNETKSTIGGAGQNNLYTGEVAIKIPRVQLGIDFLDRHFGNGAGPTTGCGAAIFAPQGHGKTSMAIQMCVSQILLGKPAVLVITEQGLDSIFRAKIYSCLTGISWVLIADHGLNLDAAAAASGLSIDPALLRKKIDLLNKLMYVHDMIATPGGLDSVKLTIDRVTIECGMPPAVVMLDWAGPLADYLVAHSNPRAPERKESALKKIASQVAEIGAKTGTLCCLTHQMKAEQIAKGPTAKADQYCGTDCRGLTESLKLVLVIGPRDEKTHIQKIQVPKARDGEADYSVLVKLDGATSTFREATGYKQAGRKFIATEFKAAPTAMPKEGFARNATTVE